MRAKKGLRKIVVDGDTYHWKVKEDGIYFYVKLLTVLDENGSCVFTRRYSPDDTVTDSPYEGRIPVITPTVVRSAILEEKVFGQKRAILDQITYKESPQYWKRVKEIYQPELIAGIGLDLEEEMLVCVRQLKIDQYRRTIIDLQTLNILLEDMVIAVPKNKDRNTYQPFGPLRQEIPCLEWSPAARIAENQNGDKICCYPFYSQCIYFQPAGGDCLRTELNKGCVKLNKNNVYNKFGFSASGNYFIAVERNNLIIWKREDNEH